MADARTAAGLNATLNERVLDRTIRHLVHVERFKAGFSRRTLAFLDDELLPDLLGQIEGRLARINTGAAVTPYTNQRLAELFRSISGRTAERMSEARSMVVGELLELAKAEADWLPAMVAQESPVSLSMVGPSTRQLQVIVRSKPFRGAILRDHWKGLERSVQQGIQQAVQLGIAQGQDPRAIARRIRGTPTQPGVWPAKRNQVEALVRTASAHVQSQTREVLYAENPRIVSKVQFVATLDTRTTVTCASLDGRTFEADLGPRPPLHWNCRSSTVPVIASFRDLGIDLDEAPPGTRASMNGQVASTVTYQEWLKAQPAEVQNEMLGATRAKAFRAGTPITSFVATDYSPLTIGQLRELERI
ncbi:minor capsid protein [Engelhardtia mirabilis]|uniref:Phage Mu protein F like protein n=1 Tax=Engelhardtia mirabilis TaxID=2528011 RepID=A0A518BL45_9BACT|nr:Phage Mu protein F like protein [Planctomycetes bacterium Pla133]QDV02026.1 Phage Mu protein F like protein [Planctomycetes bacterium Pla86]